MKYLIKFNESLDDILFESLTYNEFKNFCKERDDRALTPSESDILFLRNLVTSKISNSVVLDEIYDEYPLESDRYDFYFISLYVGNKKIEITFYKFEDEWWLVETSHGQIDVSLLNRFWKCDTKDGIIDLIDSKFYIKNI